MLLLEVRVTRSQGAIPFFQLIPTERPLKRYFFSLSPRCTISREIFVRGIFVISWRFESTRSRTTVKGRYFWSHYCIRRLFIIRRPYYYNGSIKLIPMCFISGRSCIFVSNNECSFPFCKVIFYCLYIRYERYRQEIYVQTVRICPGGFRIWLDFVFTGVASFTFHVGGGNCVYVARVRGDGILMWGIL